MRVKKELNRFAEKQYFLFFLLVLGFLTSTDTACVKWYANWYTCIHEQSQLVRSKL